MIDDPDDPDYRYPEPGERFWHRRHGWVATIPAYGRREAASDERGLRILGEVAVAVAATGKRAIVKLTNLEESH